MTSLFKWEWGHSGFRDKLSGWTRQLCQETEGLLCLGSLMLGCSGLLQDMEEEMYRSRYSCQIFLGGTECFRDIPQKLHVDDT